MASRMYTDIIRAYKNNQRVRSMNSAGTMICVSAKNSDTFINKDNGSKLHVALIPVSAIIDHIEMCFSDSISASKGILQIGFYGINQAGDFVEIKKDALGEIELGSLAADTYKAMTPSIQTFGKTVYELLCETVNGHITPLETFKPFANRENIVLSFTVKTKNDTTNPQTCCISVVYMNGAPSTTSLTTLTIDKE